MSSWIVDDQADEWLLREELVRDDGCILGCIMRAWADGPTYAWSKYGRIGAVDGDQAARTEVERALEAGPGDQG
jgi:hypothetical protein